jgi:hypothetical protein
MITESGLNWPAVLAFGNLILASAIVITAFSLLGYMLTRSVHSGVTQAFSVLLVSVLIVYACDVLIQLVEGPEDALIWLRLQWIGIAMLPAASMHLSDELLRTTRHLSRRRRRVVWAFYAISAIFVALALFTDLLVYDGAFAPLVSHLSAGSLFPIFVVYYFATVIYGAFNVIRARRRCLTPASRRRMTYLALAFFAPALGVFPYLIASGLASAVPQSFVLLLSMIASVLVGFMLIVMAYSVSYYSSLLPDRVVRQDLLHYLLRGPLVGIAVLIVMLVIPRVESILGLPRDTVLIFAVVGVIVLGQLAVNATKPWVDRLIYRQDEAEITWIQTLDRHLLTSGDLSQFLENILITLCELLRVDTGFVLVQTDVGLEVAAAVGDHHAAAHFAAAPDGQRALQTPPTNGNSARGAESPPLRSDGAYWYAPLLTQGGEKTLGVLALKARTPAVVLDPAEQSEVEALLARAAAAAADRYVQEGVFMTLQSILPDLDRIQEWRGAVRYAAPLPDAAAQADEVMPATDTSWQQSVKDALTHYWGGPKLSESPLARLKIVNVALQAHDGNLPRALRSVLQEAIERQRPAGERKLTTSEWLLYNILDFRFIQGQRVRDIANRLAMSESDLYRKQRAAVAEVARTLAAMEAAATAEQISPPPDPGADGGGQSQVAPEDSQPVSQGASG